MRQPELFERFRALHEQEGGVVMPNPWDGVSALLLKQAGFMALGSSSAAIAFSLGRLDGAHGVGRAEALENAALLGRLTGLPINADLEDGFGPSPEDCAATVEAAIAAGMAGVGIEDTTANPEKPIHDFDHAVERIRQAAQRGEGAYLADRPHGQLPVRQAGPGRHDQAPRRIRRSRRRCTLLRHSCRTWTRSGPW